MQAECDLPEPKYPEHPIGLSLRMARLVQEEVKKANPHLRPAIMSIGTEGRWQVRAWWHGELEIKCTGSNLPPDQRD